MPAAPPSSSRFDGWISLLTGLGTVSRDRRESMRFVPDYIDWRTAEHIWEGDDLAARIIETEPDEMVREGFDLCITDDDADDGMGPEDGADYEVGVRTPIAPVSNGKMPADLKKEIEHRWEELDLFGAINKALRYENAYGGAAILIGAQDGATDLQQPLAPGLVKSIDFLTVMEPREIQPVLWYGNPRAPKYGRPAVYQLNPITPGNVVDPVSNVGTVRIHESRLIVFDGIRVTNRIHARHAGWGDSILTRVYRVLRDYNLSWAAAGSLVTDFAQAVYKMKGLNDLLQEDGKDLFKNRMLGMNLARSVANATMIDSEDEFTRIVTPISGLPELLDRFTQRLAMSAGLPLPLLSGDSPGGLNASGASGDQLRMFYDRARSKQKRKVVPPVRRITALLMQTLGGEPAQWTIEPRPLWQPTQKEQIETRKTQCDIDCEYLDRGVNSQEEIRDSRFGGAAYSFDTRLIDTDDASDPTPEEVAQYATEQKPVAPPKGVGATGTPTTAKPGAALSTAGGTIAPVAAPGADIQKQALNGAQTQAMMQIVVAVVQKEIPLVTAQIMLELGFQLSPQDAARMLAPTVNFDAPKSPEPPPIMPPSGPPKPPAFAVGQ